MKLDKKAGKLLRESFAQQRKAIDKLTGQVPDDLKDLLSPIGKQYDLVLASLPADGGDSGDDNANVHQFDPDSFSPVLTLVDKLSTENKDLRLQVASIDTKVTEGIKAKVDAGELITKENAQKATDTALTQERQQFKLASDRRTALVTASLPIPADEAILLKPDAEFRPAQETAAKRVKDLTAKKVTLQPAMLSKLAWTDEADYTDRVALIDAAQKVPGTTPNPFAGGGGAGDSKYAGVRF